MAKTEPYDVGDVIPIRVTFTDSNGNAADPTTVTVAVKQPDGTETDVSAGLTHSGVGLYDYDLELTASGRWWVRAAGTGAIPLVRELSFGVRRSAFQ